MTSHPKIFALLKDYMDADCQPTRRITAQEFRTFFYLPKSCSPAISGYFQRIYQNPNYRCPFRVARIDLVQDPANPYRSIKRYLVEKNAPDTGKIPAASKNASSLSKVPCER